MHKKISRLFVGFGFGLSFLNLASFNQNSNSNPNLNPNSNSNFELFWMKIKATNKYERTQISNTGAFIENIGKDYVIVLANLEEKTQIESKMKEQILQIKDPSELSTDVQKNSLKDFTDPFNLQDFPIYDKLYTNYERMQISLQQLRDNNPNLVELKSIGTSVENRDIWVVRISANLPTNPNINANRNANTKANFPIKIQANSMGSLKEKNEPVNKPAAIFLGAHHAREHLSVEVPLRLALYLVDQYRNNNERIVKLLQEREVHIIPMVNPDGAEFDISTGKYAFWRKNRARNNDKTFGVDLNRNYGFQWGVSGSSSNTRSETYMGPSPFSEPETQAVKRYLETNNNIKTMISFHTYSELILYPWGYKFGALENQIDKKIFETLGKQMAKMNGYTSMQSSELYAASGDTVDWAYSTLKIYGYTFELDPDSHAGGSFYPGPDIIESTFEKNIEPCLLMIEVADEPSKILKP